MTHKEKMENAMELIQDVIAYCKSNEFISKSEKNEKIAGAINTFGNDFILKIKPLASWVKDSD